MGKLLHPYGIRARQFRVDGANIRGYEPQQFEDAFARYLPPRMSAERYTATSEGRGGADGSGVAVSSPITSPLAATRPNGGDLPGGTLAHVGPTP